MISVFLFSLVLLSSSALPEDLFPPRIENVGGMYDGYRLPTDIIPATYDIDISLPQAALTDGGSTIYAGRVTITFLPTQSTNIIRLHSLVNVLTVQVTQSTIPVTTLTVLNQTVDDNTETLTLFLTTNLTPNVICTLFIVYSANLDPINMRGFYRSEYFANGTKEYLGVTQFQPTQARRAFPCFDEPHLKAVFRLTLTYPQGYTSLANTLPFQTINDLSTTTTTFQPTPTMSTYLLAFAVSKFTCTPDVPVTVGSIPYSVCSRPDLAVDIAEALTYGRQIMEALDTWTGIGYSSMNLEKLHQIALPDFSAGAMENWGLVTYRENMLLNSPEFTSELYRQRILAVIAHELAHMWFGNLVTMQWWSYTFLNEGFASYFQYFALELIPSLPDFEIGKQFIIEQQQTAFIADSYETSSSLSSNAWTSAQIRNKFNVISYNKGASILRMLENTIGSIIFRSSVRRYLTNNQYSSTTPDMLWNTISTDVQTGTLPVGVNLPQILDNWTNRPGFPVVSATLNGTNIILTQKRFLYSGNDSTQWYVPVSYITSNSTLMIPTTIWLLPDNSSVILSNAAQNSWVIINHDSTGYYRVHYDTALRDKLVSALSANHLQLSDLNRAQLIDDALNLARAGQIRYSEAFQYLQYLRNETSYYPWFATIRGLNYLSVRFGNDTALGRGVAATLLQHIENISANISTTNWSTTNHVETLKLQMIWAAACRVGQQSCITESKRLFRNLRINGTSINPNIRDVVYCNALRYSDNINDDWNFLWNRLNTIDQPHETLYIFAGLGCARDRSLLSFYLDQSINSASIIRIQDMASVWSAVYSSSDIGLQTALDYFLSNHTSILNYYSDAISILSGITDRLTTNNHLTQLDRFVTQTGNSTVGLVASNGLATIRQNIQWQATVRADLEQYFGIPSSTGSSAVSTAASILLIVTMFLLV